MYFVIILNKHVLRNLIGFEQPTRWGLANVTRTIRRALPCATACGLSALKLTTLGNALHNGTGNATRSPEKT